MRENKMNETNFSLAKIERGKRETDEVLWVQVWYDYANGVLRNRIAQLEVQYVLGKKPIVRLISLDMCYLIPTIKERVYFKNNRPIKIDGWNSYPSMAEPKHSSQKVDQNYLKNIPNYKLMVELIPDSEPIKQALEDIVR